MKIAAIICEYNPLHKGHALHINATRENCDLLVCLMSGSFTQRGEPAIFDKFYRARCALAAGADIVAELPTYFATGAADDFAVGAVSILDSLNCIDELSFGSECGDIDTLCKIAEAQSAAKEMPINLKSGKSWARNISELMPEEIALSASEPNNILGAAYLRALKNIGSSINPVTIKRLGSGYNDSEISSDFPSATALRAAIFRGEDLSKWCAGREKITLEDSPLCVFPEAMFIPLIIKLRTAKPETLAKLRYFSEGIEHRIIEAARTATSYDDLCNKVKSKRYTMLKVKRLLLNVFLEISEISNPQPCFHILAAKKTAIAQFMAAATDSKIQIVVQPKGVDNKMLERDVAATDVYMALAGRAAGADFTQIRII